MRKRAFLLIIVLLLSSLLCLLAIAYLTRTAETHRTGASVMDQEQAYQLALAGLEGARVRLDKDQSFPPIGPGQEVFSCLEAVYGTDGTVAGHYQLTVDGRWRTAPYFTLRVSAVGLLGEPSQPQARRHLWAELDLNPTHSSYFQFVHTRDEGSL